MTDRRDDKRERTENDEDRLREEQDRRSDELKESWRRNHPSEQEKGGKDRPEGRYPD